MQYPEDWDNIPLDAAGSAIGAPAANSVGPGGTELITAENLAWVRN
jgi:hypothetical protein